MMLSKLKYDDTTILGRKNLKRKDSKAMSAKDYGKKVTTDRDC